MQAERRQSERVTCHQKVIFGSKDEFLTAFIVDMGSGGLFLKTNHNLLQGEHLYLEFNLPETNYRIESEVEVRWTKNDKGVGVKFVSMSRGDVLKFSTFLDSLGLLPCTIC